MAGPRRRIEADTEDGGQARTFEVTHQYPSPLAIAADGACLDLGGRVEGRPRRYGLRHLDFPALRIKRGERVRQKDVIGTVGNTGYSTAPHLHYEFLVNGVHRDPRTIVEKLPMVNSVAKAELPNFFAQTRVHLAELEKSDTQMASAGSL